MRFVLLILALIGCYLDINSDSRRGCCGCKCRGEVSSVRGGNPSHGSEEKFDAEIIVRPDGVTIKNVDNTLIELKKEKQVSAGDKKIVNAKYYDSTKAYKFDYSKMITNAKVTVSGGVLKKAPYLIAIVSLKDEDSTKYIVIVSKEDGNMESLFSKLNLTSVSILSSNGIISMGNIFNGCKELCMCNINMDTSKVTNMSGIFYKCSALTSLSDISKWNTNNVTDMHSMFDGCRILSELPDISKWNTINVTNMSGMFFLCKSLTSLPDISKWNTSRVTNMKSMFYGCESLTTLPDISKWNTSKVTNMSYMFERCKSLSSLPDISKWNTNKVTSRDDMFVECTELKVIPDIFK